MIKINFGFFLIFKEKECIQIKQKCIQMKKELDEKESQLVILEYNRQKDVDDRNQEILTLQQLLQGEFL